MNCICRVLLICNISPNKNTNNNYAGTVINQQTLIDHPEVADALDYLTGNISTEDMKHMNYEVDIEGKDPSNVAHDFLVSKHLI